MDEERSYHLDEIPWRKFATKPLKIEAIQLGVDVPSEQFPDLNEGDYLVRNPEAGQPEEPDVYYRTKEEFNELYGEVQ
jgi:hypothetical protein